jgi:hypothetical protein
VRINFSQPPEITRNYLLCYGTNERTNFEERGVTANASNQSAREIILHFMKTQTLQRQKQHNQK